MSWNWPWPREFPASPSSPREGVALAHHASGRITTVPADQVVVVGERRPRATPDYANPLVLTVGDAVVPRRVAHAIAEGREAAVRIAAALRHGVAPTP
ncbi:hypothetical protein KN815_04890 [Streptomyces sp. 4503]|uniref:Uncharacterized protein n=1 Tax=Streptomyces niphimycinicus TaxID=2842201 RepID=A0ABS6C960_9ACTN|nr:hypothetical protein [Streptomyces niphimycinicus]MBU3863442.1 hypothetical protein [Streptomyces niphimycinicus]